MTPPAQQESTALQRPGILINPLGGINRRRGPGLMEAARSRFDLVRRVITPAEISAALEDFSRKGVDLVVISGGDGTVQATITALFVNRPFDHLPMLAVLAGGTTNLIAGDVGVSGNQEENLRSLREFLDSRDCKGGISGVKRHVLRLRQPGRPDEYGMFLGAAGISRAVRFFKEHLGSMGFPGRIAVPMAVLHFLWTNLSRPCKKPDRGETTVRADGRSIPEGKFLLVLVTTLERLFLGIRPFSSDSKGCLHLLAASERPLHLPQVVLDLLRHRKGPYFLPENGYYSLDPNRVEIDSTEGVALDGQIFHAAPDRPFVVECGGELYFVRW